MARNKYFLSSRKYLKNTSHSIPGQKFFDSGDYQMAKQKMGGINKPPLKVPGPMFQTGEAIPTPETVPARKTSLVQPSKLASVTLGSSTNIGSNVS